MSDEAFISDDGQKAPRFARVKGRLPPHLSRCLQCQRHLYITAKTCPFCGVDLVKLARRQRANLAKAEAAATRLQAMLERLGQGE